MPALQSVVRRHGGAWGVVGSSFDFMGRHGRID